MANLEKSLSSKSREDGKRQVLVRISSGRDIRFRVKSSVFVSPEFWDEVEQCVKVPVQRRTNKAKVDEAKAEKAAFDDYFTCLVSIINAAQDGGKELTKEWVENAFALRPVLDDPANHFTASRAGGVFTADNIERATQLIQAKQEQDAIKEAKRESSRPLYDLIPDFCRAKNFVPKRVTRFNVLARLLARYEMFQQMADHKCKDYTLAVGEIEPKDIENFREYVRHEDRLQEQFPKVFERMLAAFPQTDNPHINRPIKERGENYVFLIMKQLKSLIKWCQETGRTDKMPFRGVEIGHEEYVAHPIYISREERDIIAGFDLCDKPSLQRQRDIFIFQCLTGCRVSDLYSLTERNIIGDLLVYVPAKTEGETSAEARVPLGDAELTIIDRYAEQRAKTGKLLPFTSQPRYNDAIRELFGACGITRNVIWRNPKTGRNEVRPINEIASSHMARRTFVGNLYKQVHDPNLIGKMSGHTEGSKAFARYRAIDDDLLREVKNLIK